MCIWRAQAEEVKPGVIVTDFDQFCVHVAKSSHSLDHSS